MVARWRDYAASTSPVPDFSILAQYGLVGFIALIAMVIALVLWRAHTAALQAQIAQALSSLASERERGDRLEAELRAVHNTMETTTMRALEDATTAVTEALRRRPR